MMKMTGPDVEKPEKHASGQPSLFFFFTSKMWKLSYCETEELWKINMNWTMPSKCYKKSLICSLYIVSQSGA